jgi:hypothetical protein
MVSQRSDIVYLQTTKPCIRKHLITKADRSLVNCLCECVDNILRGTDEKVGLSQKEESDLTERWIFGIPTSTDCICNCNFG